MKIVFDGHIFRWQQIGGVSRYFREIIQRLPADWEPSVLGEARSERLPAHPRLHASPLSPVRPRSLTQPLCRRWWKWRHLRPAQVVHPTYFNLTGGLSYADFRCPVVITVHDMIAARYPDLEDNAAPTTRDLTAAAQAASHAICVSKATETDFLERHPHLQGRTTVIHHGSSFPVEEVDAGPGIFERPTFLFVGRRATYKNFLLLLRAFAKACKTNPNLRLCTAGAPLTEEERWQIHFLGLTDRVVSHRNPSEAELQQLYRSSVALLYPSRHEGFGIPPLEAMACGTLPVTSNTTSLPEVMGDAGIMLDPTREDDWADCMLAIAGQKVPRAELLARGRRRARELTWAESARRHVETYRLLQS